MRPTSKTKAATKVTVKVEVADAGPLPPPRLKDLVRLAESVLHSELPKTAVPQTRPGKVRADNVRTDRERSGRDWTVNLVFCENAYIRDLNKRFRKLDKATDVLSFIYDDEDVFGEIYIATLKAQKQAPRWKNTFYDELRRLVVHGSLHLAGYDHMNAKDRKAMRALEDAYLA